MDQNSDLTMSDIALKSDSNDAYAVAMPKGSDDLKAKVNKVIAKLKKEGKIDSYVQDAYALSLKSSSKSGSHYMKKFWFMLTALVATCFLVACSGSQGVSTKTIKEKKKIVVATESEFAPFEFKSLVNGKDTLVGADIELAKAIGEKTRCERLNFL